MELTDILTAISTVGFPIAACIGLFWMINKSVKEMTAAINNNTQVILRMTERMDRNE